MKKIGFKGNKFVIDSFGWIEYLGEGELAEEYAKYIKKCSPGSYFTPSIIIYEVFKRMRLEYDEDDAINAIMQIQNYTTIIDIDTALAIKGAETNIQEKLPMADAIIRATANTLEAHIITSDPHFKDLDNVVFIE